MASRRPSPGQLVLPFSDDPGSIVSAVTSRVRQDRPDARCVPEMALSLGAARIDLAVVDDALFGYEVKGRRDTLDRLPRQAEAFGQVFERLTLVTTEGHLRRAAAIIPDWWGIDLVDDREPTLTPVRPAGANPDLRPEALVRLLWRDEVVSLLRKAGHSDTRQPRRMLWQRLVETMDGAGLSRVVCETLRQRAGWRAAA
jgi:hypothetical protein